MPQIPAPTLDFDRLQRALARVRELRLAERTEDALEQLQHLEREYPKSGSLWQERGLALRARAQESAALAAFRRAVELNDTLSESWQAVLGAARAAGRRAEAEHAAAALAKLKRLPAQLREGSSRLSEGDLDGAESAIRAYLTQHGPHLEGMRLLAQICIDRAVYDDAELLLEAVLERDPQYHDARHELTVVMIQRHRYWPAQLHAKHLLGIHPGGRAIRLLYAKTCDGLGQFDEALRIYRELLNETPGDAELEFAIANVLRNQGRSAEAIAGFQNILRMADAAAGAYAALANMKTYRFSDAEILAMRALESSAAMPAHRYPVCFALGKALEDRQQFEESFQYYARGNSLKRAELSYSAQATERNLLLREEVMTAQFLAQRSGAGCLSADPIFIVGLPRSGSTLIEQILASHSQVDGTLELPEIPRLIKQFRARRPEEPPRYPAILGELSPQELYRLGEIYLEETRVYRQRAPFFIDKLPANFQEVGFIHLILPNAKIIDARRDAMACCFSNYQQLYASGQDFSYDLSEMGRYYRGYVRLMEHWDRVLPGKVLHVRHADLVHDFEATVRRILAHCDLPFEPACLEFYKTERSVRTVSSEQVRQPINRAGIDRWRHYEPWLGALKEALGPLSGSS
jgi:tetratricopeptide (TPR) repeat protein